MLPGEPSTGGQPRVKEQPRAAPSGSSSSSTASSSSSAQPSWTEAILGKTRASALDVITELRGQIASDLGGTSRLRALRYLQQHNDSLASAERLPRASHAMPQPAARELADRAAWFACLCNAAYGTRGALLFSAWAVAARAPAAGAATAAVGAVAAAAEGGGPAAVATGAAVGRAVAKQAGPDTASSSSSSAAAVAAAEAARGGEPLPPDAAASPAPAAGGSVAPSGQASGTVAGSRGHPKAADTSPQASSLSAGLPGTAASRDAGAGGAASSTPAAESSAGGGASAGPPGLGDRFGHAVSMFSAAASGGDIGVFASLTGLRNDDVLHAHLEAEPHFPAHFLVRDSDRKLLILVVRGTISEADVVTDVVAGDAPFLGGQAHEAMARSANALYASLMTAGPGNMDLAGHLQDHPGYSFALAGHSLGGGVASLLHCIMHDAVARRAAQRERLARLRGGKAPVASPAPEEAVPAPAECWCFGAPPVLAPLDTVPFSAAATLTQVVVGEDSVPRLSLWSVRRLARLLRLLDEEYPPRSVGQVLGVSRSNRPPLGVAVARAESRLEEEEFHLRHVAEAIKRQRDEDSGEEAQAHGADALSEAEAARMGARTGGRDATARDQVGGDQDKVNCPAPAGEQTASRLFLPGKVVLVGSPGTPESLELREVSAEDLGDIPVSSRAILDHMPTAYVAVLRDLAVPERE